MRHFFLYWLPLLAWMMIIFMLSHQNGDTSSQTSEWVLNLLQWLNIDLETLRQAGFRLLVRKAAHMTEYFVLYLLVFRLIKLSKPLKTSLWVSLLFTLAYASTDEFHQIYIPGRVGTIFDVGIDGIGATIALLLCWYYYRRKTNN
ncbi:MAG: VanZ family protein [Bacteroidia bacterium]